MVNPLLLERFSSCLLVLIEFAFRHNRWQLFMLMHRETAMPSVNFIRRLQTLAALSGATWSAAHDWVPYSSAQAQQVGALLRFAMEWPQSGRVQLHATHTAEPSTLSLTDMDTRPTHYVQDR